jgi:type II secretory pathway component PulK
MIFLKVIKDKKGAALFFALIIIAVVATLATALFAYSSNSILGASQKEELKQIDFLAR